MTDPTTRSLIKLKLTKKSIKTIEKVMGEDPEFRKTLLNIKD